MYNINDRASAIYNVQRFLYLLSKNDSSIPVVYPDGIFGIETTNAVRAFQTVQGIDQSGIVDYNTFTRLVDEYRKVLRKIKQPVSVRIFPRLLSGGKILPGETHSLVRIIQAMLLNLGTLIEEASELEITGTYDKQTEIIINKIKSAAGMNSDSVIDKETYEAIVKMYESFINDDT